MTVDLRLGDCLDVLPGLAAGSVDAVVTDPPYGVDFGGNVWDAGIPNWLGLAREIAPVVVFTTAPTTQWDYPRPDWVGCLYRAGATSRNITGGFNHWTPIVYYGKHKWMVDSFWTSNAAIVTQNTGIDHPSPKPLPFMLWLVEKLTSPGDTVLDPFMGSGTTGVACAKLGRSFIGIERDETYFKIAERRIAQAQAQLPLPLFGQEAG